MPFITFNSQDIIFLITSFIDLFAIIVIGVSVSLSILPLLKTTIKSGSVTSKFSEADQESGLTVNKRRIAQNNFMKGLLLALELESANAILKLGIFTSILTGTISTFNMNNFIFFIGLLSIRIAINQSLRRFNI
jgi:hypothetical protein